LHVGKEFHGSAEACWVRIRFVLVAYFFDFLESFYTLHTQECRTMSWRFDFFEELSARHDGVSLLLYYYLQGAATHRELINNLCTLSCREMLFQY
jgi:hypothetical protein